MTIIVSSSSSGMLVKKLRRSKRSSSDWMPVNTADPCISAAKPFSILSMRRLSSSGRIRFSGSLSTNTNHDDETRLPGYALPTLSNSACLVTNSAIGGSSGSTSMPTSGISSSGAGSKNTFAFCCQ